jgi:hypothetical protein
MPLYEYVDKATKKELSVLRSFDDYKIPPTDEEAKEAGFTAEELKDVEWVRLIGGNIQVTKSDSWGPGKGSWGSG